MGISSFYAHIKIANMKMTQHKGVYLKLNTQADEDIITRLDSQSNKQGYIKDLIRTDIELDVFRHGVENEVVKIEADKEQDNNNTD